MISATGRRRSAEAGFTFIELFLVIIIIGALTAATLPGLKKTFDNLQLNNFSRQLQVFMNYLHERAVVQSDIICLNVDNEQKEAWAQVQGRQGRLKTLPLPERLNIETESRQILFYPDGSIDKVTIGVVSPDKQKITLTTKGVLGGVKLLSQD